MFLGSLIEHLPWYEIGAILQEVEEKKALNLLWELVDNLQWCSHFEKKTVTSDLLTFSLTC